MSLSTAKKVVAAPPAPEPESQSLPAQAPISIHVAGDGLLVDGRFDHWKPVALNVGGGDSGTMHLLFDATGSRTDLDGSDLFSFKGRWVRPLGPFAFAAKGTLRAGTASRVVEAVVSMPRGHTPFFSVIFPVDREVFPSLWQDLQGRAAGPSVREDMRARAWLRAPTVATA